jgi:hypothetical protein
MTEIAATFTGSTAIEAGFVGASKENVTTLSIGIRSRDILDKDTSLAKAISTLKIEADSSSTTGITILLPGIVYHPSATFEYQIPELASLRQTVVGINYSDNLYSQELLKAQIVDFVNNPENKDREITLLGVSLGACIIIDLLGNTDIKEVKNLKRAIMLGTIYSDKDILNGPFGKAFRLANKMTPDVVVGKFVPLVKRLLRADPMYTLSDRAKNQVQNVSNEALVDRINAFGKTKAIEALGKIEDISVLFGWWKDDYASPETRQKLKTLFQRKEEFLIDGHHGWTSSNANQINTAISRFFSHQNA